MEIPQEDYNRLKEEIELLRQKVESYENTDISKVSIRNTIKDKPITDVWANERKGIFEYNRRSTGVWELFIKIAKELCLDLPKFIERKHSNYCFAERKYNYFDTVSDKKQHKLLTNLTDEEFTLASEMLNEMSAIYNKYYKKLHPTVLANLKNMDADDFSEFHVADLG